MQISLLALRTKYSNMITMYDHVGIVMIYRCQAEALLNWLAIGPRPCMCVHDSSSLVASSFLE